MGHSWLQGEGSPIICDSEGASPMPYSFPNNCQIADLKVRKATWTFPGGKSQMPADTYAASERYQAKCSEQASWRLSVAQHLLQGKVAGPSAMRSITGFILLCG